VDHAVVRRTDLRGRVAVALVLLAVSLATLRVAWPLDDFEEYWAAGRLNAVGANPYDPAGMLAEQQRIGWHQPQPVMMYNPPWTLAVAMPLGALEFNAARSIWLPLQMLLILWCAVQVWTMYGGDPRLVPRICCVAVLWEPTFITLRMGQVSPLILLGIVGFVLAARSKRDVAAGLFFSLTALKPQLLAPLGLAVVLWAVFERRWRIVAAAMAAVAVASAIAMFTNPLVFTQYSDTMRTNPPSLAFESPNVATILRMAIDPGRTWPQYIPTVLAGVFVGVQWYRKRHDWDWLRELPALLILSCLATAYGGWTFDLLVLLVPIVAAAAVLVQSRGRAVVITAAAAFALISGAAFFLNWANVPEAAFIWVTPVVGLAIAFLGPFSRPAPAPPILTPAPTIS
jgi:hypothetical protein